MITDGDLVLKLSVAKYKSLYITYLRTNEVLPTPGAPIIITLDVRRL